MENNIDDEKLPTLPTNDFEEVLKLAKQIEDLSANKQCQDRD